MPDESRPLFGEAAAALGHGLVKASVERDTAIVRNALRAIWVDTVIEDWLSGRNAFLDSARPIVVLTANDLPRVMEAVRQEIQGGYR
ncbi:hypothetical protein PFZ49_03105 [Microbacterium lacticum]|uniref:hypothetical protein n=1 Tax=Microbacterium lacticum TaxID=33885 RepID=UPI003A85D51A